MDLIQIILFLIGMHYLYQGLFHVWVLVLSFFHRNNTARFKGSWALVTACTDGIGLAFAHELAASGLNIVQVGRNKEKLDKCADEIRDKFGVEVVSVIRDFLHCTRNPILFFKGIFEEIKDLDVCLLVNNVGSVEIGPFLMSQEWIVQQNALNIFPVVFMTKLFLDRTKHRKLGAGIINMSSLTAEFSTPLVATYAAGKSLIKVFSCILQNETSFDILCYQPGYVWTPLGSKFRYRIAAISNFNCASLGLKELGNSQIFLGHWTHYLCFFVYWLSHLAFRFNVWVLRRCKFINK